MFRCCYCCHGKIVRDFPFSMNFFVFYRFVSLSNIRWQLPKKNCFETGDQDAKIKFHVGLNGWSIIIFFVVVLNYICLILSTLDLNIYISLGFCTHIFVRSAGHLCMSCSYMYAEFTTHTQKYVKSKG